MKKFAKIMSMLLVLSMVLGLAACGAKPETPATTASSDATTSAPAETTSGEYVDPFADLADDYDELSQAVYDLVLGDFEKYYNEAMAESSTGVRFAKMAIAEAKLLGAGIFIPTRSNGGFYGLSRMAPHSHTLTLWGNDTYRYHDVILTTEPIKASDVQAMREKWNELIGTGEYEDWAKSYLQEQGYTLKNTMGFFYTADPNTWDCIATSNTADVEMLVNTFDSLAEYDMENQLQPALAESWEVSEDGLTYTFHLRKGATWVDNQGRYVADVVADDFVAGMQHVLDAMGGLEYLLCQGCANIVGTDAYVNGETTDFSTVGVKALDDHTLQYTLTQPTSYFLTMLGYSPFAPMSRSFYESMGGKFGEEYDASADSYKYGKGPDSIAYCGPFVVTNFTSNNTVAMKENESYWNKGNNNVTTLTFIYTDSADPVKPYDDFMNGLVDSVGLTGERIEIAKEKDMFEDYAFVGDMDATSFCGFLNLRRAAFANANDASMGVSPKTEEDIVRTGAAMLNQNFRLAVVMSLDRANYNAQSFGEETKLNNLINSYTPGTFVTLPEDVTVDINGTATTFPANTFYGEIVQAQLDADGIPLTVWNGTDSTGFDGWYSPENAQTFLAKAVEELAAQGIEVSAENPIYLDIPTRTDSQVTMNQKQSMKQSIEASTNGFVKVNLIEYSTQDTYLDATYWYTTGNEANYDLNDGSGWGPDFGDPSSYLGTMLPQYAGYMTKCLGIF